MTAEQLKVAPVAVRVRAGQVGLEPGNNLIWRRGPETPDGFWMIYGLEYPHPALRVIIDGRAPVRTYGAMWDEMGAAIHPGRADKIASANASEDAYLTALTIAAEIPPDELVRLRDAVRAGQVGGRTDGRRVRKAPRA